MLGISQPVRDLYKGLNSRQTPSDFAIGRKRHPRAQRLRARKTVYEITIDMCAFQLRTKEGDFARKPTMLVTNCFPLVKMLHKRCPGDHRHQPLLGGRAAAAAQYTTPFVKAILQGLRRHLQFHGVVFIQEDLRAAIEPLPQALFHAVDNELRAWANSQHSMFWHKVIFSNSFKSSKLHWSRRPHIFHQTEFWEVAVVVFPLCVASLCRPWTTMWRSL